jgi:Tfp pilus assembly protein PilF
MCFALCAIWCSIAGAQGLSADEVTRKATMALASGDFNGAAKIIDDARAADRSLNASSELDVLRGVAWQQAAARMGKDDGQYPAAMAEAGHSYRRALSIDPRSGAALNNLAALTAAAGDDAKARELYTQAIELADARQGFYALNYARFLESRDPKAAIEAAKLAVRASPASAEAREFLGALYARTSSGDLLRYARTLLDEGYTKSAAQVALGSLSGPGRAPSESDRTAALILLAAAITREPPDSLAAFDKTATASSLRSVTTDPEVGRGAQELLDMFDTSSLKRLELSWWWRKTDNIPSIQLSGRGSCRSLLRALGETYLYSSKDQAQRYFKSAIELGDHGPDPEAFLRLVELYVNQGPAGEAELKQLMDRYQFELFTEKGEAYRRGDWPLIYRLHLALGMTYAHLKIWQGGSEYQNAMFQLSAARNAAQRLNDAATREGRAERTVLPPVAVQKLAEAYAATGKPELGTKVKIDTASQYQKLERPADSAEVLKSVSSNELARIDATSRSKYEQLLRALPQQ